MSFSTLEDVNGTQFDNQGFWWYTIDTRNIQTRDLFTNYSVKYDGFIVERTNFMGQGYQFTIVNNTSLDIVGVAILSVSGVFITDARITTSGDAIEVVTGFSEVIVKIYMGVESIGEVVPTQTAHYLVNDVVEYTLKDLGEEQQVFIHSWVDDTPYPIYVPYHLVKGYNIIKYNNSNVGFLLVKLLKTDFQFNCSQSLIIGKVNTVSLGADSDYLPNGDLVGEYTPSISVEYDNKVLPVRFNGSDYVFDLDLTDKQNEGKVRFKVIVEANDVLNATETDVALDCTFETINTVSKLQTLFRNGGTGRLGDALTLSSDLTVTEDVYLIGNDKVITMTGHKIVVPVDKTFKADNVRLQQGKNIIQQEIGSTVELTNCAFVSCTGLGSVIDCQVDVPSLSEETDFKTTITDCTFINNDICVLHGGDLTVTGCTVTGKISDAKYPYFLYQTDGNATLTGNTFNLSSDTQLESDLEFNSCIFVCGETAQINGYDYTELQQNDLTAFLETARNTSTINVTYYYDLISDYITLQSDNGYCHSVSGVSYVFKTNVIVRRA